MAMSKEIKNHSQYEEGIFTYTDHSFSIQSKKIYWKDIICINAYKIDQITVDCIVVEIQLAETSITLNEEMKGFMKFMESASTHLPNFKKDWFEVIAFPPFETNFTTIYERQLPS
jgi:hypothetical protein